MSTKVERLDNAFLFILGLVTFAISLMQVLMKDLVSLLDAIPFILIGIAFPFYLGYIKGAIELDSLNLRLRGWMYLIIGTLGYFGIFSAGQLNVRTNNNYFWYVELFLFLVLLFALFVAWRFLLWIKKIFPHTHLNQYSISATILSAFTFAVAISIGFAYFHDVIRVDSLAFLTSPAPWFFLCIILFSATPLIILEKANDCMINIDLTIQTESKLFDRIFRLPIVRGLNLGTAVLEYSFDYNLKSRMLWLLSFTLWFIAAVVLVQHALAVATILFILSFILALLAEYLFLKTGTITFEGLRNTRPKKSFIALEVFVIVILMVFTNSLLAPMLFLALLAIGTIFIWRPQKKQSTNFSAR